jgi:peptide/nickel transport system substrate-binding protein
MDDQFKNSESSSPEPTTEPVSGTPETELNSSPPADAESAAGTIISPEQSQVGPKPGGNKKRWLILAVTVLLAAGGAAYGLSKLNKSEPTTNQTANAKKTVPLLKIGVTQPFPTDFYPDIESSILPNEINNQIFEGLTKYQNGNQIVPNLAQSWTNPDNTTWTFKLLQGVKFHNGHSLDATAVTASLKALQTSDYGSSYATTIKDIKVVDTSTVQITTTAPDPLLPSELANLWIYDTTATKANDPGNGTGPYNLKPGTKLNKDSLQLVADDSYHGGKPQTKELDFKLYEDAKSQVADIKLSKLDIADLGTQAAVNEVTSLGYKSYGAKSTQVYFLMPNTLKKDSPLANVKVRKAIYEAVDPAAIMKADERTGSPATQLVPQEIPGYNPAVSRPKLDATQAKTDLTAAGFPNGFTITFTYFAPHQAMAVEVQKELAAIGVKLTLDPQTVGKDLAKKALGGGTDLFYYGYGSNLIDSSDVIQPLIIDTANYKNAAVDSLYTQASTTLNTVARLKLLQQVNQAAMDDVAVIPLFTPDAEYFAVKSNLVLQTDNLSNYIGSDFWTVYSQ